MKTLSLVALFASALSLAASPVVIYSSFGDEQSFDVEQFYTVGTTFESDYAETYARAQSFVATDDYILTSARVALTYEGVGVAAAGVPLEIDDSLFVSIRADDFDLPGEVIFGIELTTLESVGENLIEIQFEGGIQLDFGAQYWLSLETGNPESFSTFSWYFAPDNKQAPGATGTMLPFVEEPLPLEWSSAISNEAAFSLHGTVIPEPSVYAAGAALLVLGICFLRRRNR